MSAGDAPLIDTIRTAFPEVIRFMHAQCKMRNNYAIIAHASQSNLVRVAKQKRNLFTDEKFIYIT